MMPLLALSAIAATMRKHHGSHVSAEGVTVEKGGRSDDLCVRGSAYEVGEMARMPNRQALRFDTFERSSCGADGVGM